MDEPEAQGEPAHYSATVIVTVDEGGPVEVSRSSVFRSGELYREEWSERGEARALIWRPDMGKSFLLSPDRRVYIESAIGPGEAPAGSRRGADGEARESDPALGADEIERAFDRAPSSEETRRLPDEVVDGHACAVYEKRRSYEGGRAEVTTVFRARDLEGLALKTISETDSGGHRIRVIIRRGDVRTTVNPDVFTVPSDFKKVDRLF